MSTSDTSPLTIGLTGGIGSGKSAVSQIFTDLGVTVIDTDLLSRELVKQGSPLLNKIKQYFGNEIISKSGELDRKQLRQLVFKDKAKKQWLEKLLHPEIKYLLLEQLKKISEIYVVVVVPLLLENNNYAFINRILVVDCSEALQLSRAITRDQSSSDEIKKIIASQMPRSKRLMLADDIIVNEGTLESLEEKVLELHEKYQKLKQNN
ncbi:dephospho-CoA kinase [Gammaproteobacteria bacterium]|nr:dephospho-CoA kinase [Gammaproteobacteria bacterium]